MNDTPPKRPLISLPFLVIVGVLAAGAYFAGPSVMQWVMLQQEKAKQGGGPSGPKEFAGLSELAKSLKAGGDPEAAAATMAGADDAAAGGGGNRPDPETRFAEADADGNGKLEGDEISERMQGRLEDIDTDGDGAVSKDEYMTMVESFRNRGGNQSSAPSGDAPASGSNAGGGAGGSDS